MSLHDAMKANNGGTVSTLVREKYSVNGKNSSGLTVIQFAAIEYYSDIGKAGSLTEEAQQLRAQWRETIKPLIDSSQVTVTTVTLTAWNSSSVQGLPSPTT
jgi:hypothetical protein